MHDKRLESKRFFEKIAPCYDGHKYAALARSMHKRIAAGIARFTSVLDVGCGTGALLALLKGPGRRLAGADLSPKMIREAKKKLGRSVELKVADAEKLPWRTCSFDLVVCSLSFHHYPNPIKALAEMRRVLKRDGELVLGDPWAPFPLRQIINWSLRFGTKGDVRIYSKAELEAMAREMGFVEVGTGVGFTVQLMRAKAGRQNRAGRNVHAREKDRIDAVADGGEGLKAAALNSSE